MNNISCIIDSREKKRILYAEEFFKEYSPVVQELETGDYLFSNNDTGEIVVFEYKTIPDFIASVNNSRIFKQAKRLNTEFDWNFIVISGSIEDFNNENRRRKFQPNTGKLFFLAQYYGAIARLNCYTTVTQCYSQAQAFNYMEKQMLKIFDNKPLVKNFKHDADNAVVNFLCCINGVNVKTANLIVDEFNISNLHELIATVNAVDLTEITGIGTVTADKIKKNIIGG